MFYIGLFFLLYIGYLFSLKRVYILDFIGFFFLYGKGICLELCKLFFLYYIERVIIWGLCFVIFFLLNKEYLFVIGIILRKLCKKI